MLNKKIISIISTAFVCSSLFISCGNETKNEVPKQEQEIVNVPEKNENENNSDKTTENNSTNEGSNNIDSSSNTENQKDKNTTSNKPEIQELKIYSINSNVDGLIEETIEIKSNEDKSNAIINKLKEKDIIDKDTKLINLDINKDDIVIKLSKEFYNKKLGTAGETLMLKAISNSFAKAYNIKNIKLLIDGKPYESGHIIMKANEYLPL